MSTREHLSFDSEFRNLRFDWSMIKTGKMKTVFFNNHATSYVTCVFNALHAYFVTTGSQAQIGNFLFGDLCQVQQPSNKIGKIYAEFYADEDNPFKSDVPTGMTGSVRAFVCVPDNNYICTFQGDRNGVANMVHENVGFEAAVQIGLSI